MIAKPVENITKADIDALLANKVAEGKTIDYKLTLPGGKDEDKKEFLADVSSFANAAGGDLVFGVSENAGVPVALPGLVVADFDAEILRLESTIRDGIEPRLQGVQLRRIDGFATGPLLIMRVPRSWASPHMVTFKNTSRFFTRSSAGKYQMDVGELRSAFAASESLGEKLQRFRTERLSKIIAGEGPVELPPTPKMVLHILPFAAFTFARYIEQPLREMLTLQMRPLGTGGWTPRHNLDGFLTFDGSGFQREPCGGYCQFFRTGALEAVCAALVTEREGRKWLPSVLYEQYVIQGVQTYLKVLGEIQVSLPLVVTLSMTGMRGVEMAVGNRFFTAQPMFIDRDVLLLPDTVVDKYDVDVPKALRPIFDAVWNAAGYERSFNYDENGNWKGR